MAKRAELKPLEVTPRMRERCRQFITNLRAHPDAAIFLKPVDTVLYRDYLEVVQRPMDLGYVGRRWRDRALWYSRFEEFGADMRLMIDNCFAYNDNPVEDQEVRGIAMRVSAQVEAFLADVYSDPDKAAPRQPRNGEDDMPVEEVTIHTEWVQCDRCKKWRKLPPGVSADALPSRWTCPENSWAPLLASCDSGQEVEEEEGGGAKAGTGSKAGAVTKAGPGAGPKLVLKRKAGCGEGEAQAALAPTPQAEPSALVMGAGTPGEDGEAGKAGKSKKSRKSTAGREGKEAGGHIADKCSVGTPEHEFWRGLERTWDETGLFGNSRKLPLFHGRGLDLLDLYAKVVRAGGFDVVNGRLGGWSAMMREVSPNPSNDTSGSFRLKKVYERQVLEYERRCGVGWTPDSQPTPSPVLTAGFVPPAAGVGLSSTPAPIGPVPVPSAGYLPPLVAIGEIGPGGGTGTGVSGAGEEGGTGLAASKKLKTMFATGAATTGWGVSETGNTFPAGSILDLGAHEYTGGPTLMHTMAALRLPYEWRAPESVPLFTRPLLTAALPCPPPLPRLGVDIADLGPAPSLYPLHPSESDLNWGVERAGRVLSGTRFAMPAAGRGRGHKGHSKSCMWCADKRKALLPVGTAAALAAGKAVPAELDMEEEDEEEEDGAGVALKSSPSSSPGVTQPKDDDMEMEEGGEEEEAADVHAEAGGATASAGAVEAGQAGEGKKKWWIRRRAAPFKAWALCSGCKNIACLPCLLPTPQAAGVRTEAERVRLLAAAADASCKYGACTPTGRKCEISDVGLWFCPDCAKQRKVAGFADLPFCSGCCGALDGPPAWEHSTFDLAALQRTPSSGTPPPHWPSLCKCEACGSRSHGVCAWRAGAAAVTLQGQLSEHGAVAASTRAGYVCGDCVPRLDPHGRGVITLTASLAGMERETAVPAAGGAAGNGVVLLALPHAPSRELFLIGQLTSEHEQRMPLPAGPTSAPPAMAATATDTDTSAPQLTLLGVQAPAAPKPGT